jgi:hypothetical protein
MGAMPPRLDVIGTMLLVVAVAPSLANILDQRRKEVRAA